MTSYPVTVDEAGHIVQIDFTGNGFTTDGGTIVMGYSEPVANRRYSLTDAQAGGVHDVSSFVWRPGAIVSDVVLANAALIPNLKYAQLVSEQEYIAFALSQAAAASLSDVIQVHQAETLVRALIVAEALGLADLPTPALKYTQLVEQGVGVHDALTRFLGGALADGIGLHDYLDQMFRGYPALTDGIGIAAEIAPKMILRVITTDDIHVSPLDALNAIYNGVLIDSAEIAAGYVAPSGSFTTWAMNTRTAAVTEYQNYAFNSFAQIGKRYFGASSTGLYELIGETDAGTSIIADIKSGFAQWSQTHLGSFKAAYLAARGGGDFVLKITTGDGVTVNYAVTADNMASTKIHVGKGLRARYFSFELISAGQDFDLDTLEFIPITNQRRV